MFVDIWFGSKCSSKEPTLSSLSLATEFSSMADLNSWKEKGTKPDYILMEWSTEISQCKTVILRHAQLIQNTFIWIKTGK